MFDSLFIQDWIDMKKELTPISTTSIDDHQHRKLVTSQAKLRRKNSEQVTFKDKTSNVRQRREEELVTTTNMLGSTSQTLVTENVSVTPPSSSKVIPLPKGRKRRTSRGK